KPYELIYGGKRYRAQWDTEGYMPLRYWAEITESGSGPRDVFFPYSPLETDNNVDSNDKVSPERCLFFGDYMTLSECDSICRAISPDEIEKGECISSVCFCLWSASEQLETPTYLSWRASGITANVTLENFIEESKNDGGSNPLRSIPERQPVKVLSLESVIPEQPQPEIPLSNNNTYDRSKISPTETCLSVVGKPKPSCNEVLPADECPAGSIYSRCGHDDSPITQDKCDELCKEVGRIIGIDVQKGLCRDGTCYCEYSIGGQCKTKKLSALEKHKPKNRPRTERPGTVSPQTENPERDERNFESLVDAMNEMNPRRLLETDVIDCHDEYHMMLWHYFGN
ncbi:hypothetical protein QAD02_011774, partial [Eretmocerus hayati]